MNSNYDSILSFSNIASLLGFDGSNFSVRLTYEISKINLGYHIRS